MKYIIADTETIGLQPPPQPNSGVVQVAWVEICPSTIEELGEVNCELVNPGVPIHPEASKVHGIFDKDVKNKPTLEKVFNPKEPVVLICHNFLFDRKFLYPYIENLAGELCTLNLARLLVRGADNHKLQTLADYLNLEKGKAHDAGGDVATTHSLLKYLVKMSGRALPALVDAARVPKNYAVMPFGKHKGVALGNLPMSYVKWFLDQEIDKDLRYSLEQQIKIRG